MRASHHVYDGVLRLLPSLYASGTVREVVSRTIRLLPGVIKADGYAWLVYSLGLPATIVDAVESEPSIMTNVIAGRRADFPSEVGERHRSENRDIHRDMRRQYLTIPVSFTPGGTHAVSVRRDHSSFTEEDRLIITVLAPHLRQAFANAITFEVAGEHAPRAPVFTGWRLTTRESDVAFWLSQGKTNPEIGFILGISGRTVEKHVEHVFRKLGIENRGRTE